MKIEKLIGKVFIYNEEEYVVEEILTDNFRCECRSWYSEDTTQFYCDFVEEKVKSYEHDKMELEKNKNAFIFKENDEKELLKEIVKYYIDNHCFDYRNLEKMVTLGFIKEKVGM